MTRRYSGSVWAMMRGPVDVAACASSRAVWCARSGASASTWLCSIAMSVSLNGLRKVKRFREREVALEDAPPVGFTPREADPDLKTRLARAIEDLPEGYRAVFVMHDVEGFTHEEIGRALGVQPGTSKAQLFRARAKLRQALADFAGDRNL